MTPSEMRELRIKAGRSLREIARIMGVSAPFLSDLERGNRRLTAKWEQSFKLALEQPIVAGHIDWDAMNPAQMAAMAELIRAAVRYTKTLGKSKT